MGAHQSVVGVPPSYGSLYFPHEYGGAGGSSTSNTTLCGSQSAEGGEGGGVIEFDIQVAMSEVF